jgi:DNA polymerase-3 subunit beta
MKFICSQKSLLGGIQTVQKGISNKIGLPIYDGIFFESSSDNKIHLFATDLEIGIDCYIPAQVIENGSIVIPNKIISELIRKFPPGNIEVESLDNNIVIKENSSNYKILAFSSEEFSNFPEMEIKSKIKINQKLLKESIQQVIFSTSKDENRSFLNGALFKIMDNKIEIVTTDSHRLSLKTINNKDIKKISADNLTNNMEVIIPYRALSELSKLLLDNEKVFVEIGVGEKQILFILFPDNPKNSIRLYSRLIEGQFPDYHQILPNSFKTEIKIDTNEFRDKMERISLLAREDLNIVKIETVNIDNIEEDIEEDLGGERKEIILKAESSDIGEAFEKVPCFKKGEDIVITFNSKYILDVLRIIKTDNTIIKLNDSLNPVVINPEKNKNYLYILMPLKMD